MRGSSKVAAVVAAGALVVPTAAEAAHGTGKAGAPGQTCKSLRLARKAALREARRAGKTRAEIKALDKTYRADYKRCIQAAAKARGHRTRPPARGT